MCRPSAIESSAEPHPINPAIHAYISRHPCGRSRPPHVMNIFTLIGRLGIFHLARRCVGWNQSVSIPSILYLYRQDVSVFLRAVRASLHAVFIRNSRMSDEPEPDANDPFVLARKSLEFDKTASWAANIRQICIIYT